MTCDQEQFERDFLSALESAFKFMEDFYGVKLEKGALDCIKKILMQLFKSNKARVGRQIAHLTANLPNLLNICRYAAQYAALLYADTVVRIAIQESSGKEVIVTCGHGLMAIRDTDGWGWGDGN